MSTETKLKDYLKAIEKDDKKGRKINAFLELNPKALEESKEIDKKIKNGKAGKLAGKIIAVKANINVLGLTASCASKTLETYKSCYDASVIEKIKKEDGLIIGMTNMDEFACGSSGQNSAFGSTKNPKAIDRIPGGTSSGSAAAVAAGFCDISLGTDTGGSIRCPASCCGLVGIKPTYGLVSRYGLIDSAMSFDQIGVIAKNTEDALLLLNIIKGKDEKDATSIDSQEISIEKMKKIKIGLPEIECDKKIWKLVKEKIKKLKFEAEEINIPHIDLAIQTYYPIQYVEFFSGTRKFDGRRYGKKIEDSCGEEVLRRILGGKEIAQAEYAGKYYRKALQARALITKELENAFKEYDALIIPTLPILPWKIDEKLKVEDEYNADALTVLANLAGIPAISIPAGEIEDIPIGMQIISKKMNESLIFSLAEQFQETK